MCLIKCTVQSRVIIITKVCRLIFRNARKFTVFNLSFLNLSFFLKVRNKDATEDTVKEKRTLELVGNLMHMF
jgi:hypothetical protein